MTARKQAAAKKAQPRSQEGYGEDDEEGAIYTLEHWRESYCP